MNPRLRHASAFFLAAGLLATAAATAATLPGGLGTGGPAVPAPDPAPGTPPAIPPSAPPSTPVVPSTPGNPVFEFRGRGWGHGVGMSQFGAKGAALAGWNAPRILAHYYRGTQLSETPGGAIRILLAARRPQVRVQSDQPWQAVDETAQPETAVALAPDIEYLLRAAPAATELVDDTGKVVGRFPGALRVQTDDPAGAVRLGAVRYRGALRAVPSGGRIDIVNVVALEQYLYGVVPREMPAKWGDEAPAALEAQAVAARTYAVAGAKPQSGYDHTADQRSQVYGGVAAEDPRTTSAVDATRGQILTYQGSIITAFFFSTSGGRTESVENVFTKSPPLPYLVSVPDPFDKESPYHRAWPEPVSVTGRKLARLFGLSSAVTRVQVLKRGASPRVRLARLVARDGSRVDVTGAQLRLALGLRDTWFTVRRQAAA
jgi:stage II sporulation protein D